LCDLVFALLNNAWCRYTVKIVRCTVKIVMCDFPSPLMESWDVTDQTLLGREDFYVREVPGSGAQEEFQEVLKLLKYSQPGRGDSVTSLDSRLLTEITY
jgi:hypothetical protein